MTDPREPAGGEDQWGNPQQQGWGQPTPPQHGQQGWGQPSPQQPSQQQPSQQQPEQQQPGQQHWGQQSGQPTRPPQQNWSQDQPTQQAPNPQWGQQPPPQQWGGQQPGQQNWGQQPGQQWGGQQAYGSGQGYQQFPSSTAGSGKSSKTPLLIIGGLVIVAVIALAAVLFSMNAKDTLSQSAAQQGVSKVLTESYGLTNVSDVSCPSGQKVEKDTTFTCTVLVAGDQRQVTVKFTDDNGTYEVGRPS